MEKKKLKIEALKVNSFITELKDKEKRTVDGGLITVTWLLLGAAAAVPVVNWLMDEDGSGMPTCEPVNVTEGVTGGCAGCVQSQVNCATVAPAQRRC